MAISVISVSSDSSKESVGTSVGRVILFGTIPTTIHDTTPTIPIVSPIVLPSPNYTPASPDYSPISDMESNLSEDPLSNHIPPVEVAPPSQIPPAPFGVRRRRRVGPLPTHHLAVRHSVDYSLSDHFTLDDSSRDSSSDSLLETSSDSSLDDLSDSSSGHSSLDHSSLALPSGMRSSHQLCSLVPSIHRSHVAVIERPSHSSYVDPSCKRSRSPTTFILLSSPIPGALSSARVDLLPTPKRIRSSKFVTDLEDYSDESYESAIPRETGLGVDIKVEGSDELHLGPDIDLEVQAEIDECIAYADALRARGIDVRVVVETVDRDEVKTGARGLIEAIESIQRDQGHMIIATGQQGAVLSERIRELERDNMRLRDMMDIATLRLPTIPNTRSGATMTREGINELIDRRVAEALEAHDAVRNLEPLVEGGGEQEEVIGDDHEGENEGNGNGGNKNGGVNGNGNGGGNDNENGNGNGGGNGFNFGGFMPVARECTYQDFLKCQPLNFNGTKGVVGLTRWFKKMETVFHISNCPPKYQVKYASCTLLNSALTWWNSHKRTVRVDAAYAMKWTELMKLMTEVYCPRNEIQKMETELWNLSVKGNDLTAYTRRFQELVLLCTRMVSDEEDKVKRFIGGLPDNIQGNVIAVEPTRL
ncbi:putative reverse transcriptase domain-containing protein [Tanacetum coccineum]